MECLIGEEDLWGPTFFTYDHRFGYRKDGKIVGVIGLSRSADNMIASKFFVQEDCRRQGIGSIMLEYCEKVAKEEKCRMLLYVDKDEEATDCLMKFYTSRGYMQAGAEQASTWLIIFDDEMDILFYKEFKSFDHLF